MDGHVVQHAIAHLPVVVGVEQPSLAAERVEQQRDRQAGEQQPHARSFATHRLRGAGRQRGDRDEAGDVGPYRHDPEEAPDQQLAEPQPRDQRARQPPGGKAAIKQAARDAAHARPWYRPHERGMIDRRHRRDASGGWLTAG